VQSSGRKGGRRPQTSIPFERSVVTKGNRSQKGNRGSKTFRTLVLKEGGRRAKDECVVHIKTSVGLIFHWGRGRKLQKSRLRSKNQHLDTWGERAVGGKQTP